MLPMGFIPDLLEPGYFEIRHDIHYGVDAAKLFAALTGDVSAWWGAPYLVRPDATAMQVDPRVGGLMQEVWPGGGGALWGVVNEVRAPEVLELQGPLGFAWPTRCKLRLELVQRAVGTRLSFVLKVAGDIGRVQQQEFEDAWLELLGERLKAWVERGEKRGIGSASVPWAVPPPGEDGEQTEH
jgi:uncharacterized protein YndB with AHSA1/START domain